MEQTSAKRRKTMTHMVADEAVLAVLGQAQELIEIRDASGKVVGFFSPVMAGAASATWGAVREYLAELQRRAENQESCTTREVFEHLLSVTPDEPMRAIL